MRKDTLHHRVHRALQGNPHASQEPTEDYFEVKSCGFFCPSFMSQDDLNPKVFFFKVALVIK